MGDTDKVRFLDAPISQGGHFGASGLCPAVLGSQEADRYNQTHPGHRGPTLCLPCAEGIHLRQQCQAPCRKVTQPTLGRLRRVPETGDPEMVEVALLQKVVTVPLLPLVEGWEDNFIFV